MDRNNSHKTSKQGNRARRKMPKNNKTSNKKYQSKKIERNEKKNKQSKV